MKGRCITILLQRTFTIFGRKRLTRMQWLQDRNQSEADNLKTVGREASRH